MNDALSLSGGTQSVSGSTCRLLLGGVTPEVLRALVAAAPCRSRRVGHDVWSHSGGIMAAGHWVTMSLTINLLLLSCFEQLLICEITQQRHWVSCVSPRGRLETL